MFKASDGYVLMSSDFSQQENLEYVDVDEFSEVEIRGGWMYADKVTIGTELKMQDDDNTYVYIFVKKIDKLVDKNQIRYYY